LVVYYTIMFDITVGMLELRITVSHYDFSEITECSF
jgi:hypothetical protein